MSENQDVMRETAKTSQSQTVKPLDDKLRFSSTQCASDRQTDRQVSKYVTEFIHGVQTKNQKR